MGKVETAIQEELDRLVADGITTEELDRAREGYLQNQIVEWSEDAQLNALLSQTLHGNRDMSYYTASRQQLMALSTEDVANVLKNDSKRPGSLSWSPEILHASKQKKQNRAISNAPAIHPKWLTRNDL